MTSAERLVDGRRWADSVADTLIRTMQDASARQRDAAMNLREELRRASFERVRLEREVELLRAEVARLKGGGIDVVAL